MTFRGTQRVMSSVRSRVDRFGQKRPVVGDSHLRENNPVDGAVLEVILRKAEKIREELGVLVRCPTTATLSKALMKR
jgi:hypothetical protein